ncbi:DNA-directed RNA polymerase I subunit RPA2 [Ischnura elegans]|uniref:DNA-directed RNA polymerase I subunit RPA2 n=1 Tax=Ischnura elegans TaxID=197161 RepID=UPI001ED86C11|nr:DNA-directed RNA polymerase I subunit RPA2 [Ischnura elegans]
MAATVDTREFIMKDSDPSLRNLITSNYRKIPEVCHEFLQSLGKPHVESFDAFLDHGLHLAVEDLDPEVFELPDGKIVKLVLTNVELHSPRVPDAYMGQKAFKIYPSECRQRKGTYKGRLFGQLKWFLDGEAQIPITKELGEVPIMVKSKVCWLGGMAPQQLVDCGEHEDEFGGYFIVKGHERVVRMLLVSRQNFPIAITRNSWRMRGPNFSDKGVIVRCVQEDHTTTSNVLHFLTDGTAKLMFSYRRMMYFVPVIMILKCFLDVSDEFIFNELTRGREDDDHYISCVMNMLQELHLQGLHSQFDVRQHLGQYFRPHFINLPHFYTDEQVCLYMIKNCIVIHLKQREEKFYTLVYMMRKLFSYVQEECGEDGTDSVAMQELLLGGHLYLQTLKEKMQNLLGVTRMLILKQLDLSKTKNLTLADVQRAAKRSGTLEAAMESFISTGNIVTQSGLGLQQHKGLVIMAENINRLRYMSHFRAVHRGSFFTQMRSTEARKLLPESWGFLCPVHTPDGTPCGLLNHLTKKCHVVCQPPSRWMIKELPNVLISLGMLPLGHGPYPRVPLLEVMLDGCLLGFIPDEKALTFESQLRMLKVAGIKVPRMMEIVMIERKPKGQYPGIYLFTSTARLMRPVLNIAAQKVEMIGTFEQVYLNICLSPSEAYTGVTTHQELSPTDFLSNLACLIPMPDCNQSPRNMYQCQMAKQTMGTPCHNWHVQGETKLYRLQTPSSPLFRTSHHEVMNMDNYPQGTNAIVAVISYTGYDMEDAMVINKASIDRGFAHGSIIKVEYAEIETASSEFSRDPSKPNLENFLDADGLPYVGCRLKDKDPMYCVYNRDSCRYKVTSFHGSEMGQVLAVKLCCHPNSEKVKIASIIYSIPRVPTVGDKFASRAGQKGICSQKWPVESLPFTETGLVPDIIFNPHGFPSRMTIAMMIECMAGKSGALHGMVHDATPFRFSEKEDNIAIEYFGKLLEAGGYSYYGTERMYSGVTGEEMTADIFFGVIHYQRLRHMVSDKWQVRSTGPNDILTRQPIKGRKRGGGVRFGEMERDALISHGTSFLLQDRLFECSDKTQLPVCGVCGSLLSPLVLSATNDSIHEEHVQEKPSRVCCVICRETCKEEDQKIAFINAPYVLKYLVCQLASVNIKMTVGIRTDPTEHCLK